MIKGFKDFIMGGNLIDLAVAFVIGAAFVKLADSFTTNLISPIIGIFGGKGVDSIGFTINTRRSTWARSSTRPSRS